MKFFAPANRLLTARLLLAAAVLGPAVPTTVRAQGTTPAPARPGMREASQLDIEGRTAEARVIFFDVANAAGFEAPAARAAALRAAALSYGFDGDCVNAVKYYEMVIDYWKTREAEEPQNAFNVQGEMANEAARICVDAGDFDRAEKYYRLGSELGLKEPEPKTHPKALWDYRLAHALGRIAARRGDGLEAYKQVSNAGAILEANPAMAAQQSRFFPYLKGYVAFYTNDLKTAEAELTKALAIQGNANDPFVHALLGMTYEKMGDAAKAKEMYQKSYDLATGHNPAAAFSRPFARKKLAGG